MACKRMKVQRCMKASLLAVFTAVKCVKKVISLKILNFVFQPQYYFSFVFNTRVVIFSAKKLLVRITSRK